MKSDFDIAKDAWAKTLVKEGHGLWLTIFRLYTGFSAALNAIEEQFMIRTVVQILTMLFSPMAITTFFSEKAFIIESIILISFIALLGISFVFMTIFIQLAQSFKSFTHKSISNELMCDWFLEIPENIAQRIFCIWASKQAGIPPNFLYWGYAFHNNMPAFELSLAALKQPDQNSGSEVSISSDYPDLLAVYSVWVHAHMKNTIIRRTPIPITAKPLTSHRI